MKKIVIAIDGYSACGKSTTAKHVAEALGYIYIDSGAMYRAVTLFFAQRFIELTNPKSITDALDDIKISFRPNPKTNANETYLNGWNVENDIRSMAISAKVSEVSAIPEVRRAMVALQQKMGKKKGVVMDGRDIGTHVFPEAELKIFMTADMEVRAKRRQEELFEKDQMVTFDEVLANLKHRDYMDTTRKESPLRQADDALVLDNSGLTIEEQTDIVVNLALSKIKKITEELELSEQA